MNVIVVENKEVLEKTLLENIKVLATCNTYFDPSRGWIIEEKAA